MSGGEEKAGERGGREKGRCSGTGERGGGGGGYRGERRALTAYSFVNEHEMLGDEARRRAEERSEGEKSEAREREERKRERGRKGGPERASEREG